MILNRKFNGIFMVVLALMLVFSFSFGVLASDSDLTNFTAAPGTEWTTVIDAGDPATLQAGPANASWSFTGFSTEAAAANVDWTVNAGNALIDSISQDEVQVSPGVWASQVIVDTKSAGYGVISLRAANTNPGASPYATVDLTVLIEATSNVSPVDDVAVEVFDVHGDSTVYVWADDLTVDKAANGGAFYNIPQTAQSFPTAATALDTIVDPNGVGTLYEVPDFVKAITVSPYNGYISGITAFDWLTGVDEDLDAAGYVGWNYRIVRDGAIVPESEVISAAAIPLEAGDTVHWAYGTFEEAQDYFDAL